MDLTPLIAPERRTRMLRTLLRAAARGGDPEIGDLARDVLAGRHTLREAINSTAYAEAISRRLAGPAEQWAAMSESARQQALADAPRAVDRLLERVEEIERKLDEQDQARPPSTVRQPARRRIDDDETMEDVSYLVRPPSSRHRDR